MVRQSASGSTPVGAGLDFLRGMTVTGIDGPARNPGNPDSEDEVAIADTVTATDPGRIAAYHAHVYFRTEPERAAAATLRAAVAERFPAARLGTWHDQPVGPHPVPMYQILFAAPELGRILPFLMLNRGGLSILLHPESGDDYADHADHAAWLGAALPLRLEVLRAP
jgi:aromatic ring-cleaving dioxygenase